MTSKSYALAEGQLVAEVKMRYEEHLGGFGLGGFFQVSSLLRIRPSEHRHSQEHRQQRRLVQTGANGYKSLHDRDALAPL